MEHLQTIWTALTSENLFMIKLANFPLAVLEATISVLLFTTILNIIHTRKQNILYIAIFSIIAFFNITFVPTPYNTFINVLLCPVLVMLIYKINFFKAILAEIIPYVFFVIIGLIISNVFVILFDVSNKVFNCIPIYKISFSLISYATVYMIYVLFKYCNINFNISINMSKRTSIILFVNLIAGILAIVLESYISAFYTDDLPTLINLSSVLVLFVYFAITLFTLLSTIKLEQTTQDLEQEKLYNKTLTILYDNIRGFKHDFNNIVQAIGGYVASNNIEGLKSYYNDLLLDCQKSNNLSVYNPELFNNPALYSLLTSKYHKAEGLGIKNNVEVLLDLSTIKMKPYELSRVLGILIDNAIEAASQTKEKIVNISFRKDIRTNLQLIIIENSYANKEIDTDKIFEKGYTSKTEDNKNHGLGLWEVRQILRRSTNLNLFTTKNKNYFIQQLEIY